MYKSNLFRFFRFNINSRTKTSTSTMDEKLVLYGDEASPPVRFVLMTASILGIKLDYREINVFNGEQRTDFYKKINPLQKVPALVMEDQVICDSHAICLYLCQQSDRELLYPNDAFTRAKINEMLFFNSGTLFPADSAIYTDYFSGKYPVDEKKLDVVNSALDHLEFCLTDNSWVTGDKMRLCDISLMATVTAIYQIVPKMERHKHIDDWLKKFELMPFYEINRRGTERLMHFIEKFSENMCK